MPNDINNLDGIDEEIIRLLQSNARMTIADMAREINELTENAIRYRIEKLEANGYIKNYTVQLDFEKFGMNQIVILNLNLAPKNIEKALKFLEGLDNITDVYLTSGKNSIVAIGYFRNQQDVTTFVTDQLKKINVITFDIITILKRVKHRLYGI
jgi:DNA-binding Lrp family transcriptional regulator